MLREPPSIDNMRSTARDHERFDPVLWCRQSELAKSQQTTLPPDHLQPPTLKRCILSITAGRRVCPDAVMATSPIQSSAAPPSKIACPSGMVMLTTPGFRHTGTNGRSGQSHAASGLWHVDVGLRTIFLPVTFFTTQSTLGSRHKALFRRVTLTFEGYLAVTLSLPPLHSLLHFLPLLPLLLPLCVVFLISFP